MKLILIQVHRGGEIGIQSHRKWGLFLSVRVADRGLWDVELVKIFVFHWNFSWTLTIRHLIQCNLWMRNQCAHVPTTLLCYMLFTCEWAQLLSWTASFLMPVFQYTMLSFEDLYPRIVFTPKIVSARMLYCKTNSETLNRKRIGSEAAD